MSSIVAEGKIVVALALDDVRRGGGDNGIEDNDYRTQGEARVLVRGRSYRYAGNWYGRGHHTDTLGWNEKSIWRIVTANTCGRTKSEEGVV